MVLEYGLWDQLRVDHGREWYLMLHVHQSLAHLRGNCAREPIRQTSSTKVCMHTYSSYNNNKCTLHQEHLTLFIADAFS